MLLSFGVKKCLYVQTLWLSTNYYPTRRLFIIKIHFKL